MIVISGFNELNEIIIENQNKCIVLCFGSTSCSPCKKLKDKLENEKNDNLFCISIDVNDPANEEICDVYLIKIIPTTIIIKLKIISEEEQTTEIVNRVDGYDWVKFKMNYNDYINNHLQL
jgi:thiol-disulfide isomerase/thioredoxin